MKAKEKLNQKKKPMGSMMQRPKVGNGQAAKKLQKRKGSK